MKPNKKTFAAVMIAVMATVTIPTDYPMAAQAGSVETAFTPDFALNTTSTKTSATTSNALSKKAYRLSKKPGTYQKKIKLKLTAKNGYRVYYAKNGTLTPAKVLKSGQSKTFTIRKSTVLTLYQTKTAKTAAQLKSNSVKKNAATYTYKIIHTTTTPTAPTTPTTPSTPDTGTPENPDATIKPGQEASKDTGDPDGAQSAVAAMAATVSAKKAAVADAKPANRKPAEIAATTPVIECFDADAKISNLTDSNAVTVTADDGMCTVAIKKAGTYVLTGGSNGRPVKNIVVSVDCGAEDSVELVLDHLSIDNSGLENTSGQGQPVICFAKGTKNAVVTLVGSSSLTGCASFSDAPAPAILFAMDEDAVLTLIASDDNASLTVTDAASASADYHGNDPTDGIFSKGTLMLQSGTYKISVNGDCLKGSGKDGNGGIILSNGNYHLQSALGNAMKSKNGSISIYGGSVTISHTAQDGIHAKKGSVNITGGNTLIQECYGDGIQGEDVYIDGSETSVDITTVFADAGKNFYSTSLGEGNYNISTKTNTGKTEVVNVDAGSHKGIKAGTKACTYSYRSVDADSDLEAEKTYTKEVSGGILIAGGQIKVDTTQTGIKYNGSKKTGASSTSAAITPANNDGQYIIGAAEDAVHSNNDFCMAGGTLEIASADDGITAANSLGILDGSVINITNSYEGIEGGHILVGSTGKAAPHITVYSNDDGVNAASKSSVHYDYADDTEEVYTKTETAAADNTFYMLDGYLNVMIADDKEQSFSFAAADGSVTESKFNADGDGIDCNGSFYAYGGTVVVYGPASNGNSPIDTDGAYYIGAGATILAAGNGGMAENPTSSSQAAITCGGRNNGMMRPGGRPDDGNRPPRPDGNLPGGQNAPTLPDSQNAPTFPGSSQDGQNTPAIPDSSQDSQNAPTSPDGSQDSQNAPTPPDDPQNSQGTPTLPGIWQDSQNSPAPPADGLGNGIVRPDDGFATPGDDSGNSMPAAQQLSVAAGTSVAILDSNGNTVTAFRAPKALGYLFYSSPALAAGSTYTISVGGAVSGTPVVSDSSHDYRYTDYLASDTDTIIQATAE